MQLPIYEIKKIINEIEEYDYINKVKYIIFLICREIYHSKFSNADSDYHLEFNNASGNTNDNTDGKTSDAAGNADKDTIFYEYEKFNLHDNKIERKIHELVSENLSIFNIEDFSPADLYEMLLTTKEKKLLGQVYTPFEIINSMLENVLKIKNICKNTAILDPACGGGYFLINIYKYIENTYPEIDKRHIVENMLYGVDIDEFSIFLSKIGLIFACGLRTIKFNIYNKDFLAGPFALEKFDVIIGNPPYVGHKNVKSEYKKFLYENYSDVYYDKSDVSYCFFKKGMELLKPDGIISFITSRYFMEALYADKLRKFIKENFNIVSMIDYSGNRSFKTAMISPLIITLSSTGNKNLFTYVKKNNDVYEIYEYGQNKLKDCGWFILKDEEEALFRRIENVSNAYLKDMCSIKQGIITGYDKAFVVTEEEIEKYEIEGFLLRKWIKNSNISKELIKYNNLQLIYSDLIKDEKECPNAIKYLSLHKDKLSARRECAKGYRKWYGLQWGRNEKDFENPKIVFPYKSKSNNFYYDKNGYFCSADVYIMNDFSKNVTVDFLISYLNSEVFEFYLKCNAKKVGNGVYEYYPNKLNNLKIFLPQENTQQNLSRLGKFSIDIFLKKLFNISEKEVYIIKKYL